MSVFESVTSVGPVHLEEEMLPKNVHQKELTKDNLTEQADLIKKNDCNQMEQATIGDQLDEEINEKLLEEPQQEEKLAKQLEDVEECSEKHPEETLEEKQAEVIDQKSLEEQENKKDHIKEAEELKDCSKIQPEESLKEEQDEKIDEKSLEEQENEKDHIKEPEEIKDCSEIQPEESLKEEQDEKIDEKSLEEQENKKDHIKEAEEIKDCSEIQPEESLKEEQDEKIDQRSLEEQENEKDHIKEADEIKDYSEIQPEETLEEEQSKKIDQKPLETTEDRIDINSIAPLENLEVSNELQQQQIQDVEPKKLDEQLETLRIKPILEEQERAEEKGKEFVDNPKVEPDHHEEEQAEDSSPVANKELADLPNETVRQTLSQLIKNSWPDLKSTEFELERASAKGDNYLGVVWRICVKSEGSLVVKLPPQNSVRRKQFFARPCFLRESLAYEHFLPLVADFQKERSIPVEEQFTQYARCRACRLDEPNECIVLEDLCRSGYDLHDRFAELPPECVRLVMRAYAKLHATSLALKQQCPERLQHCQTIVDIFEQRRNDHSLGVYFENLKQSALGSLRPDDDRHYVERLEAYFGSGTFFELLLPLISGSNCEPYAVICHGDCWNNNIMYKICEKEDRPLDVRLIDWQLMRYASPITDLAYFFFSCTSREFRKSHYKSMLDSYYAEMEQQLIRLGESVDQLFPLEAFKEQLQTKSAVGLLLAMMVLPIVTMRGQDVPDLEAISELIEAGGTTSLKGAGFLGSGNEDLYKKRMRDVILDCVDNDYI